MAVSTLHFLQKCTPNRSRDSLSICTFGCNRPRGRPLEGAAAAASGLSEQIRTVGIFTQLLLLINTLPICIPIRGQICPPHRFVSNKDVYDVKERKSSVTHNMMFLKSLPYFCLQQLTQNSILILSERTFMPLDTRFGPHLI